MVKEIEKNLICYLLRTNLTQEEKKHINLLLDNIVDWTYVFDVTMKNKCHLLVFNNLKKFVINDESYKKYAKIVECMSFYNSANIQLKYEEMQNLLDNLSQSVKIVPVKGSYLIKNVYKNFYTRTTNDFDFLFKKKDLVILKDTLNTIGYTQGKYDPKSEKIIPFKSEKRILYDTKMYNLLPYRKIINKDALKVNVFDFSHSLDFDLKSEIVEEMIDSAIFKDGTWQLKPAHFFIHMCCHHYREGSHASWILLGNDLNMIKFCDVREYIISEMTENDIFEAIEFANKYNLNTAVYFTIYFTKEIYNDGYENKILDSLNISDESFLYEYGKNEYEEIRVRKKDFWTSLFAENNRDEIDNLPKYTSIL